MTILALEFSSARRSVALARDGVVLAEADATGGRATHAFGLIGQVLAAAKVHRDEIRVIAVGWGRALIRGSALPLPWRKAGNWRAISNCWRCPAWMPLRPAPKR